MLTTKTEVKMTILYECAYILILITFIHCSGGNLL